MRVSMSDLTDDERRDGLTCAVLLLGGLDELLLAVPALRAVRDQLPRHRLVLAGRPGVGGAGAAWGLADTWVPARPWHLPRLPGLDVAVNLTDAGPESHRLLLEQRPRRLVATANAEAGVPGPHWSLREGGERPMLEHRTARWCRVVAASFHIDVDPRDGLLAPAGRPRSGAGQVLVHPGGPPSARWPADRFAAVARALAARGLDVRVLGLPGEHDLASDVAARAGLAGDAVRSPGSVGDLTSVVAGSRLVVAGDTAVGHLAGACAVPGVHIHGRTSPVQRGPLSVARRYRALYHPPEHAAGDRDPMLGVEVDEVMAAVAEVLDGAAPPGEGPGRRAGELLAG
ncbi:MAG: glycosyltransferase family 9 protein [Kineosporiaceae bacterium]